MDGPKHDEACVSVEDARTRYREILEELRTVLPGLQVLLAFLLAAPFSVGFRAIGDAERLLYGVTVVATALATLVLMSPTSFHRLTRLERETNEQRERRVRYSSRMVIAGMSLVGVAILGALLLVTRFVFGPWVGWAVGGGSTVLCAWLWYVYPLRRRPRRLGD